MPNKLDKVHDEASLVLVGDFNPAIFHPSWFAKYNLIKDDEAEAAQIEFVMNDVAVVKFKWAIVEVLRERFIAKTNDESHFEPLRDLVVGAFRLLAHTPIRQAGINRALRFQLSSMEAWHHIGHTLAPKALWSMHFAEPGLHRLTIKGQRSDPDSPDVHTVNVTVGPISSEPPVVFVDVNNHYSLPHGPIESVTSLIESRWEQDTLFASTMAEDVLRGALESYESPN